MKLLLITLSWHTDHQEALFSMYEQLKAKGIKVWTLTIANSDYPAPRTEDNFFVQAPLNPGIEKQTVNISELHKMMSIVRSLDFDAVYFESFHFWNYPIMLYCKTHKRLLVHIIHDAVIHKGDSNVRIKTMLNGEHIRKDFTFRAENEAVMLVFVNINTNTNHDEYLRYVYLMLGPRDALLL